MFEIVYMKAEFEPWWMFDGWEENVLSRRAFEEIQEAKECLEEILATLREKYSNESIKKDCFFAFWSDDEINLCEGCDEDLQLYHGVILMKDGKPNAFC